jgi:hypothetical protein
MNILLLVKLSWNCHILHQLDSNMNMFLNTLEGLETLEIDVIVWLVMIEICWFSLF